MSMLAKNLRNYITYSKSSESDVASAFNISTDELNAYLGGYAEPDPRVLEIMSSIIGVKIGDFAGERELVYTSFGDELTKLREAHGLSRKDVAGIIEIPFATYRNYESGASTSPTTKANEGLQILFGDEYSSIIKKYGCKVHVSPRGHSTAAVLIKPTNNEDEKYGLRVGKTIRAFRDANKIKATDFSKALGISITTLFRLESKGHYPTPQLADKMRDKYGLDISTVEKRVDIKKSDDKVTIKARPTNGRAGESMAFNRKWAQMLSMIEDDAEYRKAMTFVLHHIIDGEDIPVLADGSQAALVLKMISADVV